jgi:hypothetical protein
MEVFRHRPNQGALRHMSAERDPAKTPEIDTSGLYDTSLSYSSKATEAKRCGPAAMRPANRSRPAGSR